jgi:hypothetical protein
MAKSAVELELLVFHVYRFTVAISGGHETQAGQTAMPIYNQQPYQAISQARHSQKKWSVGLNYPSSTVSTAQLETRIL